MENITAHYYGDVVRRMFLTAGIVMLITLPIFNTVLPVPIFFSIFSILVVGFFAGLTNPMQKWVNVVNAIISAVALAIFEYYAVVYLMSAGNVGNGLFWVNQFLSLIFFIALYYSSKTVRGLFLKK